MVPTVARFCAAITTLSMLLLTLSGLRAQTFTGDILGTVRDSTGGAIPGAKVALTFPLLWTISELERTGIFRSGDKDGQPTPLAKVVGPGS